MKFLISLPVAALCLQLNAVEFYAADFSADGIGATHDSGPDPLEASPVVGPNWQIFWDIDPNTDTSTNSFITEGGKLISSDWGGEAFFISAGVDVSAENSVAVSTSAVTTGVDTFNNAGTEYFQWFYELDGVRTFTTRFEADGDLSYSEVIDVTGLNEIKIGFGFNISGGGNGFEISTSRLDDEGPGGLALTLNPTSAAEDATNPVSTGTVTRPGDTTNSVEITLVSSDETELTVPATVTIPAGQASATFDLTVVDDVDLDGDNDVTVTASADGLVSVGATFTVLDNEVPQPEISISFDPTSFSENGGSSTATITLSESRSTDVTLLVALDDTTEAITDASVTISANETTGTLSFTAVDDAESDGAQTVTLTLTDSTGFYRDGVRTFVVTDDEAFSAPDIKINEIRIVSPGFVPGNGEYIEFFSAVPNASLDRLTLVVLGDGGGLSGQIEEVLSLDGQTMNGNFFVAADPEQNFAQNPDLVESLSFENNDNVTFLLVTDFSGTLGEDLDTNDDGVLDTTPWGTVVDGLALVVDDARPPSTSEWEYATPLGLPVVGPDGTFAPAQVYRDGESFVIGVFDPTGENATDTPGATNPNGNPVPDAPPVLLSFTVNKATGEGSLVVTGLGVRVFNIEHTDDLNQADAWEVLGTGFTETDNDDGTTTLNFNDPEIATTGSRFYRLKEVQ